MDDYDYGDRDETKEELVAQGGMDSNEEAFMKGYELDEDVAECEECGGAIHGEKKVERVVDEETHLFCSETCADDYKESIRE